MGIALNELDRLRMIEILDNCTKLTKDVLRTLATMKEDGKEEIKMHQEFRKMEEEVKAENTKAKEDTESDMEIEEVIAEKEENKDDPAKTDLEKEAKVETELQKVEAAEQSSGGGFAAEIYIVEVFMDTETKSKHLFAPKVIKLAVLPLLSLKMKRRGSTAMTMRTFGQNADGIVDEIFFQRLKRWKRRIVSGY